MACCNIPPEGWRCTRESGHEGPCAAIPEGNGDYVAWCRYTERSIVTCDSDAPGAFRVYRRATPVSSAPFTEEQQAAIAKAIFDNDYSDMKRLKAAGRWIEAGGRGRKKEAE